MRTGAEYREALHDGRRVWVLGEGLIEDVTTHPATRAVVDEYAAWYDRHVDPEWRDIVLTPPDARGDRLPWGYVAPKTSEDLRRPHPNGALFCQDDLSQRRQPDAHAGLWPADRAWRSRRRPGGQFLAKTDQRCRRLSPADRRHRAFSDLFGRGRDDRLPYARRSRRARRTQGRPRNRCGPHTQRQD